MFYRGRRSLRCKPLKIVTVSAESKLLINSSIQQDPHPAQVATPVAFVNENYVNSGAKERGWLLCDDGQTSPAIWSRTSEVTFESTEPIRGLKIKLTNNRTDNRTNQIQFMYDDMPVTRTGSSTKTHCAMATSLHRFKAIDGYHSDAFDRFLENIPVVARRVEARYAGLRYPMGGFMKDNPVADAYLTPRLRGVNHSAAMCSFLLF